MDKLIYLDNGATTFPKPEEVYVAMDTVLPPVRGQSRPIGI